MSAAVAEAVPQEVAPVVTQPQMVYYAAPPAPVYYTAAPGGYMAPMPMQGGYTYAPGAPIVYQAAPMPAEGAVTYVTVAPTEGQEEAAAPTAEEVVAETYGALEATVVEQEPVETTVAPVYQYEGYPVETVVSVAPSQPTPESLAAIFPLGAPQLYPAGSFIATYASQATGEDVKCVEAGLEAEEGEVSPTTGKLKKKSSKKKKGCC